MKRQIKFRAWIDSDKKMVYSENQFDDQGENHHLEMFFLSLNVKKDLNSESSELMQFTGMMDNAGKEIYEGDIRRNINHYEGKGKSKPYYNYHKIVWDEKLGAWAAIHINNTDESLTTNGNCFLYVYLKSADSEHVGNIYENPELLQSECATKQSDTETKQVRNT